MNTRLRNQPVTVKPRIIADNGSFKLEWVGKISGVELAAGYRNLAGALKYAQYLAYFNKEAVESINEAQKQRRDARIRRNRLINEFGVDPLDVAA